MRVEEIKYPSWINVTEPTKQEKKNLIEEFGVKEEFIINSLDPEERPHLDQEDEQILIVIDIPIRLSKKEQEYTTIPLGIILLQDCIITISSSSSPILDSFKKGEIKNFSPKRKYRFIFHIINQVAKYYLNYLQELNRKREEIERKLRKSMKNEELYSLLDLEESLVYFSTSLKANEAVLGKIMNFQLIISSIEKKDLIDDSLIEMQQAHTMANTYSSVLSGMMDAFASVISNNLNIVMKFLTSLAIVIAIPTLIASFYGMNIPLPLQHNPYALIHIILVSLIASLLVVILLQQRDLF